jgi:NTP pyrophosphatase (non-canonical NTP hydrolase)
MHFGEYQAEAMRTAIYPRYEFPNQGLIYAVLGLGNEAGELQGALKKYLRGDYDVSEAHRLIFSECSDVLWYAAAIAHELGVSLDDIAQYNLDKLAGRHKRGTIAGSGEDR